MIVNIILSAILLVWGAALCVLIYEFKKLNNRVSEFSVKITDIYEKIEGLRKVVDIPYSDSELKDFAFLQRLSPYVTSREEFNSSYHRPTIGEIGRLLMDHLKLTTRWVPGEACKNIVVPEEATSESDPTP